MASSISTIRFGTTSCSKRGLKKHNKLDSATNILFEQDEPYLRKKSAPKRGHENCMARYR